MGERDLEVELKEKDEIIMSLRLNEHLLKDKLEISRRNMGKQLERIKELEEENERMRQFITKGKRLSVKELMENTNENELLKKKIRGLEKENEQLKEQVQILNKCCRLKLSDEAIKQAYADLNRREREKHSQGNAAYTAKINQNEVIY